MALLQVMICLARRFPGLFAGDGHERIENRVAGLDPIEKMAREIVRRYGAGFSAGAISVIVR